jgi:gas vesicle protein
MKSTIATFIGGLAVGAAAMYILDPASGRARRALVRDKTTSFARKGIRAARGRAEDLKNRAQGFIAEAKRESKSAMQTNQAY